MIYQNAIALPGFHSGREASAGGRVISVSGTEKGVTWHD